MSDTEFQNYLSHVQKLNDLELQEWTSQWRKPGSMPRMVGEFEIQRRRDKTQSKREDGIALRAWIAIGIAVAALVVSVLALVLRK